MDSTFMDDYEMLHMMMIPQNQTNYSTMENAPMRKIKVNFEDVIENLFSKKYDDEWVEAAPEDDE